MNKLLDLAAFGARETSYAQAVNSHNLANANTPGFRKDLALYSGPRMTSGLKTKQISASGRFKPQVIRWMLRSTERATSSFKTTQAASLTRGEATFELIRAER